MTRDHAGATAAFPPPGAPALSPVPARHHRPASLVLPNRPPKLVYLDLNHWIALSKAHAGHRGGEQFRAVLEACVDAVHSGNAHFPLADAIYYEVSRIVSHRQRRDLADVMERVSRYVVITSRSVIADHEIEARLDRLIGPSPRPIRSMAYLDWGIARAFGMVGGIRVRNAQGEDVTDLVRSTHALCPEGFDVALAQAEVRLNRQSIEGPDSTEGEASLRRSGYNPYAAQEVMKRRAQQEIDQAKRLADDPAWRRGRIRDVIAVHEVILELMEKLERGLAARRADLGPLFADEKSAHTAFAEMPSYDVAVTMKASYHRDATHAWTPNDINDIDALGSTLPYCDIVLTTRR